MTDGLFCGALACNKCNKCLGAVSKSCGQTEKLLISTFSSNAHLLAYVLNSICRHIGHQRLHPSSRALGYLFRLSPAGTLSLQLCLSVPPPAVWGPSSLPLPPGVPSQVSLPCDGSRWFTHGAADPPPPSSPDLDPCCLQTPSLPQLFVADFVWPPDFDASQTAIREYLDLLNRLFTLLTQLYLWPITKRPPAEHCVNVSSVLKWLFCCFYFLCNIASG